MRVLMLFLDGVGLGIPDSSVNPFFAARLPVLRFLFDGQLPSLDRPALSGGHAIAVPLDANLGIEGLPQSGTGQTALFTGVNASGIVGRHFGPYPYSTLRPVIRERNIFRQLLVRGRRASFANAFPQRFFDYVERRPTRITVTTLSCMMAGIPLRNVQHLREGKGVSADITGAGWKELGYPDIGVIDPSEAGRRLARLSAEDDFVLFEYWKTDYAGHSGSFPEAVEVLELFDGMLEGIVGEMDAGSTLLLISSDHGNVEDMSIKTHTRNPVPAILYGNGHQEFARQLHSPGRHGSALTAVTPLLVQYICGDH